MMIAVITEARCTADPGWLWWEKYKTDLGNDVSEAIEAAKSSNSPEKVEFKWRKRKSSRSKKQKK
jgi:hypothetical protein